MLFQRFVYPLLEQVCPSMFYRKVQYSTVIQSGVAAGDEAMLHLVEACKRQGILSRGMLELGMSLRNVDFD